MTKNNIISIFTVGLMLLGINLFGQNECVNFTQMPQPAAYYNSFENFPSGSTLHEFGTIKMKNKFDVSSFTDPTIIDSIVGNNIYFKGYLTFDVTANEIDCKKISFYTITDTIIINNYKIDLNTSPTLPLYIGDSVVVRSDGSNLEAVGKIDSITFCANFQSRVSYFCIEECSGTENCSLDFEFEKDNGKVNFINRSSFDFADASSFTWMLPNSVQLYEENPNYTFESEGKYEICIMAINSFCLFGGPNLYKCDSIEIKFGGINQEDIVKHQSLTPNDDGSNDFIIISQGTQIYDRNGALIFEATEDVEWTGFDFNRNALPTGIYTTRDINGKMINITLIR